MRKSNLGPGMIAGIITALILVAYATYAAYPLARGPILDAHVSVGAPTTLYGTTARVTSLVIDGMSVPLHEDGAFSVTRGYPPGYTEVTVVGADRFGRSRTRTLTFITPDYARKKEIATSTRN